MVFEFGLMCLCTQKCTISVSSISLFKNKNTECVLIGVLSHLQRQYHGKSESHLPSPCPLRISSSVSLSSYVNFVKYLNKENIKK